ncbi:MAG: hypothetical protein OXI43_14040 [Candidatus Poribacteria bacterium]|nr:hypothetical protein [Candidatus Poribacteria bacterium]
MKINNTFGLFLGLLVLFTIGCQQIQNQMRVEPNNEKQYWGDVIIGDVDDELGTRIGFGTETAAIIGDTLILNLISVSGCSFEGGMTLVASESFLESYPVQLKVFFIHQFGPCDAVLGNVDYYFDLTPIKTMYQEAYQQEAGTIILRLKDTPNVELIYEFTM